MAREVSGRWRSLFLMIMQVSSVAEAANNRHKQEELYYNRQATATLNQSSPSSSFSKFSGGRSRGGVFPRAVMLKMSSRIKE